MAVTEDATQDAGPAQVADTVQAAMPPPAAEPRRAGSEPGPATFVRMKLRLLRNAFRGAGWRITLAILGLLGGVWFAFIGFGFFSLSAAVGQRTGYTIAVLGGAGLVLGWLMLPLLVFGVDETLDPSRFATLPLRRRVLLRGLFAAAFVGIPSTMTFVATQGLVLAGGVRGGPSAAAAAFVGTVLGLCLCVAASRAVTTAMATALRSRRARDSAVLVIAVLAAGLGPLQIAGLSLIDYVGPDRLAVAARVVAWTPFGAPYALGPDVAAGRWPVALARALIVVAAIVLLLRWWAAALPAAMLGAAAGSAPRARTRRGPDHDGPGSLVPGPLRRLPSGRFAGLVGRESRYWWRDPRRRSGLVSVLMVAIVLPVVFKVVSSQLSLPVVLLFAGSLTGSLLANQFGFDGSAFATNVLLGVPGRMEVAARTITVTAITLPPLAAVTVAVGTLTGDGRLLAALGVGLAAYGASAALATILSVLVPYALPESTNPFALSTGTGGMRGFASFGPVFLGAALATPLSLIALPGVVTLGLGLVLGSGLLVAGTLIAGNVLDGRAPEVLANVTPGRG